MKEIFFNNNRRRRRLQASLSSLSHLPRTEIVREFFVLDFFFPATKMLSTKLFLAHNNNNHHHHIINNNTSTITPTSTTVPTSTTTASISTTTASTSSTTPTSTITSMGWVVDAHQRVPGIQPTINNFSP